MSPLFTRSRRTPSTRVMEGNGMREPCALIHQTAALIQPSADLETHYRIQDHMRVAEDAHEKVMEETRSKLRALSRQLESTKASATRPISTPTEADHSEQIVALDRQKFGLAKSINELEQELSTLEIDLTRLRDEAEELADVDVESEHPKDVTTLKLTIYRELGFDLLEDAAGNIAKALVRSSDKKDVNTIVIDTPHADFFRINTMWEMCA